MTCSGPTAWREAAGQSCGGDLSAGWPTVRLCEGTVQTAGAVCGWHPQDNRALHPVWLKVGWGIGKQRFPDNLPQEFSPEEELSLVQMKTAARGGQEADRKEKVRCMPGRCSKAAPAPCVLQMRGVIHMGSCWF